MYGRSTTLQIASPRKNAKYHELSLLTSMQYNNNEIWSWITPRTPKCTQRQCRHATRTISQRVFISVSCHPNHIAKKEGTHTILKHLKNTTHTPNSKSSKSQPRLEILSQHPSVSRHFFPTRIQPSLQWKVHPRLRWCPPLFSIRVVTWVLPQIDFSTNPSTLQSSDNSNDCT